MKKILTLFLSLFFAFSMIGQTPFKTGIRLPNVAAINVTDSIPVIGEKGIIKHFISRNNLVNQNNKAKILSYYSTNIKGVSASDVANFINTSPTFNITETDVTYVSVNWRNKFTNYKSTYLYLLEGVGKGQYGVDGAQIADSSCYFVASSVTSSGNIQSDVSTQFVDLGTTTETNIEDAVNNIPTELGQIPFQDQEDGYVIINVNINSEDAQYLYLSEGGAYGDGSTLVTTSADFTLLDEDANVIPTEETLQSVLDANPVADTDTGFSIANGGNGYIGIDETNGVVLYGRLKGIKLMGDAGGVSIDGAPFEVASVSNFNGIFNVNYISNFNGSAFFNDYAEFNDNTQFNGASNFQGDASVYADFYAYSKAFAYTQAADIDANTNGYIIPNKAWIENAISNSSAGGGGTGLELITEGGNSGYRIVGANPAQFSNIGSGAVDFGVYYTDALQGASGASSFNSGEDNRASGYFATTFGYANKSTADGATTFGYTNNNGSQYSLISGINNTHQGGYYNFTTGAGNLLTNRYASNLGIGLINRSLGAVVVGRGNLDYTETAPDNTAALNMMDAPLFVVGNGRVAGGAPNTISSRSNAFVVDLKGLVTAPSLTNTLIDNGGDYTLITKGYYLDQTSNYIPVTGSETNKPVTGPINFENDEDSSGYYEMFVRSGQFHLNKTADDGVADPSIILSSSYNTAKTELTSESLNTGLVEADSFKLSQLNTPPSLPTATGKTGEIRYTSDYIYLCVAENTWKRVLIATWSAK